MLEVIGNGPNPEEVIVIAGLGRSADWYRNVQAHPAVEVAIGRRCFRPAYRVLDESEALTALADYERRNRWVTPVIIRRMLSWLVGWEYDGGENSRRQLVDQLLPVIAFRPATQAAGRFASGVEQ